MDSKNYKMDSKLVHAGYLKDQFLSVNVPIYQTSTFSFKNAEHGAACFSGEEDGYIYTRIGNPTLTALENCIAELENGYKGIAVSSGMDYHQPPSALFNVDGGGKGKKNNYLIEVISHPY